jgi:hypothetical protein
MLLSARSCRTAHAERSGSALMLALLVLLVLIAITAQLNFGVNNEERVTKNDVTLTAMDLAIESAMLEVVDQLKTDGEAAAAGAGAPAGGGGDTPAPQSPTGAGAPGGGAAGGQQAEAVDSHEDSWAKPQRTQINDIELRILVQDEDSKINPLGMLTANEDEAEKVFRRVVTVLDYCREGTSEDIDAADARLMAEAMREHLKKRDASVSPKPKLLSDDEEKPEQGLPLSLAEFGALEPFTPSMFRDYRDENGKVVHSIGSFLTVWTALKTGTSGLANAPGATGAGGANSPTGSGTNGTGSGNNTNNNTNNQSKTGGSGSSSTDGDADSGGSTQGGSTPTGGGSQGGTNQGGAQPGANGAGTGQPGTSGSGDKFGIAVNVNTAPPAVLKSLMDDREIPPRWWDEVIEYRNLEEEKDPASTSEEKPDPVYDEYGREVIQRRVFDSLEELNEVNGTDRLDPLKRSELLRLLTTQSHVFSVYITARKITARGGGFNSASRQPEPGEQEDLAGTGLLRTVHAVFWRTQSGDETVLVPIVRWEVLDYSPFEVLDYPGEDR